MSCNENYINQAVYQDLNDILNLISISIDDAEEDIKNIKFGTKKYNLFHQRCIDRNEMYDRISDLIEAVNIPENNTENDYETEHP